MKKTLLILTTMALTAVGASTAHAGVRISIGVPFPGIAIGCPAPVYAAPPPVVYSAPAPVVAAPPAPVYVAPPAPVVVAPPPAVVCSPRVYVAPAPIYVMPRHPWRFYHRYYGW